VTRAWAPSVVAVVYRVCSTSLSDGSLKAVCALTKESFP